ncbi:MAG TPA: FAD binding domain-containing protein [Roseiflexaceae bacterium]|nr:FAD binding domain-containing protein [Roseiflexaceae bacterium]
MTTLELQPIADWQQPLPDAAFYSASSVEEALALARDHPGAAFLAGGTWLVRTGRFGANLPTTLVAIDRIAELKGVRAEGDRIAIGSLAVHGSLRRSPVLRARAGLLLAAAEEIAGPAVRNLATLGGNVAIGWDLVPALLALDALVVLRDGQGERRVPLAEFYDPDGRARLAPGQLITAVSIAADLPDYGYQKIARRKAVSRAIIGAAVSLERAGGALREVRIGIGGAGLVPRRVRAAEDLLRGRKLSDALVAEVGEAAFEAAADARDDVEALAWYTQEMARVAVERALNEAVGRPVL